VRLDANVTCEIHLAGKSDPLEHLLFEARITAARVHARPGAIASHRDVKKTAAMTYGAEAAFFKGVDFEPCDDVVFRAQIDSDKDNLWSAEIHTRSTCPRPKLTALASCTRTKTHTELVVTAFDPPKNLRVTAMTAAGTDETTAPLVDGKTSLSLTNEGDNDLYVEATLPDGSWVWSRTLPFDGCR